MFKIFFMLSFFAFHHFDCHVAPKMLGATNGYVLAHINE
jgi:hypothetical protein